ncbi:MAG: alpha-amylase family glycosyl hydrolase, partial [Clostridia bacterium]
FVSEWSDSEKAMEAGFDADFYLDQKDNGYHNLLRRYAEGKNLSFFDREGKGDISRFVYDYLRRFLPTKKGGLISFITGNHDITRISEYYTMHELKLIYATLFTFPGVPFMYYGDEIGMKQQCVIAKEGGYERCGCRTPMQWDNSKNKGFSNANELFLPVDNNENAPTVAAQLLDKDSLLNCVKDIIKLRMSDDAFTSSDFEVMYSESGKFPFVYKRGKYFIVVNPGLKNEKIPLNESINAVFSIGISAVISNEMLIVPPQSFTILK